MQKTVQMRFRGAEIGNPDRCCPAGTLIATHRATARWGAFVDRLRSEG